MLSHLLTLEQRNGKSTQTEFDTSWRPISEKPWKNTNLKQNKAQSAHAESTNKRVN